MDGEIKPGYLSSEFWTKNLTQLVTLGAMVAGMTGHNVTPEQQVQIATTGVAVIGAIEVLYGVCRSGIKMFAEWRKGKQAIAATLPAPAAATATATVSSVQP